mmetsp:Transcript_29734/g.39561  ORF Transcript_29734/g.39561 Transcript_29734/m.39561 type:complete len:500 (+) Transcript_29734:3923-5422(+)
MRTEQNHIIQKVFVEVNTNTSAKAHDIRLNSQSFLEKFVLTVVEEYIARIENQTKDWTIQLEKLDLNLQLEETLLGEVEIKEEAERQLDAIFDPILRDIETKKTQESSNATIIPTTPEANHVSTEEREKISVMRPDVRHQKSVLHFIETGLLPWWIPTHAEMRELLALSGMQQIVNNPQLAFVSSLLKLTNHPVVRRRFIRQFSNEIILLILKKAVTLKKPIFEEIDQIVSTKIFNAILKQLKPSEEMFFLDLLIRSVSQEESKAEMKKFWAIALDKDAQKLPVKVQSKIIEEAPIFVKTLAPPSKETTKYEESTSQTEKTEEKIEEIMEESNDKFNGIITENTGLVLLNPFIKPFFTKLNLLEEDGSLSDPVLAAHIFHFLATGEEEDFEFALIFEAFLCGLSLDEPLPKAVPLSNEIKEACHELLLAVLGHWKALKSQSIPLLRKEFLQRQGKLILKDTTPRIVIERGGVDILLDKLPWTISMLQLPWQKEMMYVEW